MVCREKNRVVSILFACVSALAFGAGKLRVATVPISSANKIVLLGVDPGRAVLPGQNVYDLGSLPLNVRASEDVSHFDPRYMLEVNRSGIKFARTFSLPHPLGINPGVESSDLPTEFISVNHIKRGLFFEVGTKLFSLGLTSSPALVAEVVLNYFGLGYKDRRVAEAASLMTMLDNPAISEVLSEAQVDQLQAAMYLKYHPRGPWVAAFTNPGGAISKYKKARRAENERAQTLSNELVARAHAQNLQAVPLGAHFILLYDNSTPVVAAQPRRLIAVYSLIGAKSWQLINFDPHRVDDQVRLAQAKQFARLVADAADNLTYGALSLALAGGAFVLDSTVLRDNAQLIPSYLRLETLLETQSLDFGPMTLSVRETLANDIKNWGLDAYLPPNYAIAILDDHDYRAAFNQIVQIISDRDAQLSNIDPGVSLTEKRKLRAYHMERFIHFLGNKDDLADLNEKLSDMGPSNIR